MELIRPFARIGRGDAGIAGGKGASLGEMTQAGIPVPPGFVLLSGGFDRFLTEADLAQELDAILDNVNREEMRSVDQASEKIKQLILSATMPEDIAAEIQKNFETLDADFVAVRSSATAEDGATAAWAGQLDTFLNTTQEDLLENVKRCWASLFTPRAIFYRFEKGMHGTKISVAVVVQKMVQSEVSGIAFSVHPVTEDYNQMIIEAGFGLGEAIVSGQVTPDSFVVEKSPRRTIDINITTQTRALMRGKDGGNEWKDLTEEEGSKPTLSKEQLAELSEIILRIEKHYGFPCDIEWAFEAGHFFITQSRPITTLSPKATDTAFSEPEPRVEYYLRARLIKMGQWAVYPIDQEIWMTEHTARYFEEEFGIPKGPLVVLHKDATWYSHIYFPEDFFPRLYARIEEITGGDEKALENILSRFYERRRETKKQLALQPDELGTLSSEELAATYEKNRDLVHRIVIYDQFGWLAEEYWDPIMRDILEKKAGLIFGSQEYNDALFTLIKPHEISSTLEEKRAVLKEALAVKAGEDMGKQAESLAKRFGWMPVLAYGTPWDAGKYLTELTELAAKDAGVLQKEYDALVRYSEIRDADIVALASKYTLTESDLQPFIDFGFALDVRNEAEYVVSFAGFYLMSLYAEITKRLGITTDELRTFSEEQVSACVRGRANAKDILASKGDTISWGFDEAMRERAYFSTPDSERLFQYAERASVMKGSVEGGASEEWKGVTASPGKARGKARIIGMPSECGRVGAGDILITFSTTVDYLPAMKKAGAIITEVGGLTCHAAVVSREFGIPCVVGLKNAMTEFKDGDLIEVNADQGTVRKI